MKFLVVLIILICIVIPFKAVAQDGGGSFGNGTSQSSSNNGGNGSYYEYNIGSGLKISVNLWGFIRSPGRYVVPSSTTLIQLLSFGGGPLPEARLNDVKIIRDVSVDSTIVEKILVMNLELFQKTADPNQNPVLYPGDTIIVPGSALSVFQLYFGIFRDILIVVTSVISIALLYRN
ncbi:MAG: hypothetical protein V4642_01690 [Bacteroidota bacterium]